MRLLPDEMEEALISINPMSVLLLQLESPLECVERAARIAKNRGARVILNPSPASHLPKSFMNLIDILVPNELEASQLAGQSITNIEQAESAGRQLINMGVGSVVITLGKQGAVIIRNDLEASYLHGHAVQVLDTTAAGDAFIGGLAVGLSEGLTLVDAARYGNAAAALTVTHIGAQPSLPRRENVEKFLGII
jgi:ribokinase